MLSGMAPASLALFSFRQGPKSQTSLDHAHPPKKSHQQQGGPASDARGLGTAEVFIRIVPHGFFFFQRFLGTAEAFIRIVPHAFLHVWAQQRVLSKRDPISFSGYGEHFIEIIHLYPKRPCSLQNHGEQIRVSSLLCPIPGNPWRTFLKKSLLCPNAHAVRPAPPQMRPCT